MGGKECHYSRKTDLPNVSFESGSESLKVRFEANAPALLLLRAIPRNPTVSSNTVRSDGVPGLIVASWVEQRF